MRVLSRISEYLPFRIRRYDGRVQQHAPARIGDAPHAERLQFLDVAEFFALRLNVPPQRRDDVDTVVLGSVVAIYQIRYTAQFFDAVLFFEGVQGIALSNIP